MNRRPVNEERRISAVLLKEGADAWNNNDAAALAAMFTADAVIVTDRPVYGEPEFDSGPFLDLSVTTHATVT